jgi:uncharacterized membrane protein/mono/diheme cytochrome c family protein
MKLSIVMSVALLVSMRPAVGAEEDIAREVQRVFEEKCAVCHGPDVPKPKGRFGYVLDLKRLRADPEKVIPSEPDQSELWNLVQRNEMPPKKSPHGALSLEQKEIIRKWIEAGAPVIADQPEQPPVVPADPPWFDRTIAWLGKFHLLVLHFPIALIVAAALAEVWSIWRRRTFPYEPARFCLWLAGLMAVPTAALGWLFAAAGNGATSPRLLMAHRWFGTSTAVLLVITAICAERDVRRGVRSRYVWLLLGCGVLMTAITAHLGGLLANGADFFDY